MAYTGEYIIFVCCLQFDSIWKKAYVETKFNMTWRSPPKIENCQQGMQNVNKALLFDVCVSFNVIEWKWKKRKKQNKTYYSPTQ